MRKFISYLTIATIVLGFAACNNEDVPNPETGKAIPTWDLSSSGGINHPCTS